MIQILEERLDDYMSNYTDKSEDDIPLALLKYKPHFKVVALDHTENYLMPDDISELLGESRIYDVYLYDENRAYHLCSFTPCYELHYVETYFTPFDHLTGGEVDKVDMWLSLANSVDDDITYCNCSDIDSLERVSVSDFSKESAELLEEITYEEAFEGTYEYVRCNQVI